MGVRSAARTAMHAARLVRNPLYAAPGHYLSPISAPLDARRAEGWKDLPVRGVDLREAAQLALVADLNLVVPTGPRWRDNDMFGAVDAAFLQGMIRHYDVRRVLEVGSGWSTVAMLDANPDLRVTCIEPYPDRLLSALGQDRDLVTLHTVGAQGADPRLFTELGPGDVLFIDSTHVVKAGSDVVWLVLHILPVLAPGVLVHIHDVHWPFEYPTNWLHERRDWTEAYLVHAFLAHNTAWQVEVMTSWVATRHAGELPAGLRHRPTGSLWIRRLDADGSTSGQ